MKKTWILWSLIGVFWAGSFASAEESISQWADSFDKADVQEKILNRIYAGQIGPLSHAVLNKETGIYLFPKSDDWIRLGENKVFIPATPEAGPALIVTCLMYNKPERGPVSAATYLIRDLSRRPEALSAGYAGEESVYAVKLPKIGKQFLVLVDRFGQANTEQWNAFVLTLEGSGRVRTVWKSPMNVRSFQLGFDTLGRASENLVLRAVRSNETQYTAYQWNGQRFEADGFSPESRIKTLPAEVWQYGSPAK